MSCMQTGKEPGGACAGYGRRSRGAERSSGKGRTTQIGPQGPAGPRTELGGSTSGNFPDAADVYFGPDGELYTTLQDVVAGRIVGKAQTLRYLTAKCNQVPEGRQLTVVLRVSEDDGVTWTVGGSAVVDEGSRSATNEVNVTL